MTKKDIIDILKKYQYDIEAQDGSRYDAIDEYDYNKIADEIIIKFEIILAKIWDCKNEQDKIFLIIDNAVEMTPNKLVEKYKKELGY